MTRRFIHAVLRKPTQQEIPVRVDSTPPGAEAPEQAQSGVGSLRVASPATDRGSETMADDATTFRRIPLELFNEGSWS